MAAPSCDSAAALSHPAPSKYQNVIVLPQTNQLIALLTIVRDRNTSRADFIFYANRIIRLLVEEGIEFPPLLKSFGSNFRSQPFAGGGEKGHYANR